MEKRLPFRTLANGFISPGREKNILLLKAEVGQAKPTTYDLPDANHQFGVKSPRETAPIKGGTNFFLFNFCSDFAPAYEPSAFTQKPDTGNSKLQNPE